MRTFHGVKNYGAAKNQPAKTAAAQTNSGPEPSNEPAGLPDKQQEAACFLAAANTMQATADFCGINVRTLRRWMQTEEFQEHYRQEQRRLTVELESQILKSTEKAIMVLNRQLDSKDEAVATRAAKALAQIAHKTVISVQVNNRLHDLEKTVAQQSTQIKALSAENDALRNPELGPNTLNPDTDETDAPTPDHLPVSLTKSSLHQEDQESRPTQRLDQIAA